MALRFGYKVLERWESIWIGDPALADVPDAVKEAWQEDGDACHLRPFVKHGSPTRISFRALDLDEHRAVSAMLDSSDPRVSLAMALLACFRLGVDFPDAPSTLQDAAGATHPRMVRERGLRMLSRELTAALESDYPGIVTFYGSKVFEAAFPSEPEKKASSQPSMPTKSDADMAPLSGAESTAAA